MSQVTFPITQFVLPNGTVLANGYIVIRLNKDCQSPNGQICAGIKTNIPLNSSGEISGSPVFWPNPQLSPSDSVYVVWGYTEDGQLVLGPDNVTITGGISPNLGFGQSFGWSFGS